MSPKKSLIVGFVLYLASMVLGFFNMWYISHGYNVTTLTFLSLLHVALSFSSIGLVGYGTYSYLLIIIRRAFSSEPEETA